MEAVLLISMLLGGLIGLAIFIGGIVFIARDAGKHNQSVALWVILFLFFGILALAIYLFVTGRVGWGLFWLLGFPVIFFIAFFLLGFAGAMADPYAYLLAPLFL